MARHTLFLRQKTAVPFDYPLFDTAGVPPEPRLGSHLRSGAEMRSCAYGKYCRPELVCSIRSQESRSIGKSTYVPARSATDVFLEAARSSGHRSPRPRASQMSRDIWPWSIVRFPPKADSRAQPPQSAIRMTAFDPKRTFQCRSAYALPKSAIVFP